MASSATTISCNIVEEKLQSNGCLLRRINKPNATFQLEQSQNKVVKVNIIHKSGTVTLPIDESVVIHRRFLKQGKASLCFVKQRVNVLLSDAPSTQLSYFLARLVPNCSDSLSSDSRSVDQRVSDGNHENKPPTPLSTTTSKRKISSSLAPPLLPSPPLSTTKRSKQTTAHMLPVPSDNMLSPQSLNNEQKAVLRAVVEGHSLFFTGSAGTGKSYLLRHIQSYLSRDSTFLTATTGLAASLIGGTTIHFFAGFSTVDDFSDAELAHFVQSPRADFWRRCKTLIIDEISMLDGRFFDKMDKVARAVKRCNDPFGGIQMIISGDFFQLPPVNSDLEDLSNTVFCFQSAAWRRAMTQTIILEHVHRQTDKELIQVLGEIRKGECSSASLKFLEQTAMKQIDHDDDNGIIPTLLHSHNEAVDMENAEQLKKLAGESVFFDARDSSDDIRIREMLDRVCPVRRRVELKVGTQVILLKNVDVGKGKVNGARGRIVKFTEIGLPIVKFVSGLEDMIGREKWTLKNGNVEIATRHQMPLGLGWSLSIHKSQGMTLDCVTVSLSKVFACGQAYVALSRAKSLSSLRVLGLDRFKIRANKDVVEYYKMLESRQRPRVEPMKALLDSDDE